MVFVIDAGDAITICGGTVVVHILCRARLDHSGKRKREEKIILIILRDTLRLPSLFGFAQDRLLVCAPSAHHASINLRNQEPKLRPV
jgi:hypothetical protein